MIFSFPFINLGNLVTSPTKLDLRRKKILASVQFVFLEELGYNDYYYASQFNVKNLAECRNWEAPLMTKGVLFFILNPHYYHKLFSKLKNLCLSM